MDFFALPRFGPWKSGIPFTAKTDESKSWPESRQALFKMVGVSRRLVEFRRLNL
jgi:hypothetical protein